MLGATHRPHAKPITIPAARGQSRQVSTRQANWTKPATAEPATQDRCNQADFPPRGMGWPEQGRLPGHRQRRPGPSKRQMN